MSGDARTEVQEIIDILVESRNELTTVINELRLRRDYGEPTEDLSEFKDLAESVWKIIQEHTATGA